MSCFPGARAILNKLAIAARLSKETPLNHQTHRRFVALGHFQERDDARNIISYVDHVSYIKIYLDSAPHKGVALPYDPPVNYVY